MKLKDHIYSRLKSLPGRQIREFPTGELPEKYRMAAVLVPLWPESDGGVKTVFTIRSETMPSHKGQVSFPGGGFLPEDGDILGTALRETQEELGIEPSMIKIMGRLDDAWSRFGFHITPYVGWMDKRPEFIPDYNEVAGTITADIETLMQPDVSCKHEFTVNGVTRISQAFKWDGGYVWGVTADILLELLLWIRGEDSNRMEARLKQMQTYLKM